MEKIRNLLDTDSSTAGDPMSQHRWTHQSAEKVAQYLAEGFEIEVSATVVRRLLGKLDYSLKSNKKCLSSGNSPDRDKQFGIIKSLREEYVKTGDPIVSVDTKKKELIGLFKNPGRTWRRRHKKVKDHDFRSEAKGLASPYGIYDPQRNFGVLVVGESADTPEFAVNSILTWWKKHGQYDYPHTKRLLILADSGGSNGARPRMWKKYLQEKFADETGLTITWPTTRQAPVNGTPSSIECSTKSRKTGPATLWRLSTPWSTSQGTQAPKPDCVLQRIMINESTRRGKKRQIKKWMNSHLQGRMNSKS
jgi:hypothetical protein